MSNPIRQAPPKSVEQPEPLSPHYLVVDDEAMIRDLFKSYFSQKAQVTTARNGREALDKIQTQHFDAIISDVDMPSLNGIDLFNSLHQIDPALCKRFLFCTGASSSELKTLCFTHQIRSIQKPICFKALQAELAYIKTPLPLTTRKPLAIP